MQPKAIFLETSALLKMLFGEDGFEVVAESLRTADRVVASRLIRVESERALIRLEVEKPETHRFIPDLKRELKELWPRIDLIEITRDVCDFAGRIAPHSRLRSLDAIHLTTFYRLRESYAELEMLTFDERIRGELCSPS